MRARRSARAALVVAALAGRADALASTAPPTAVGVQPAASVDDEALATLRELAALDLSGAVVAGYRARVAPGGDLEHSGEARALVARALAEVGAEADAEALVGGPTDALAPDDRRAVALTRAWLAMRRDALDEALDVLLASQDGRRVPRWPDDPEALLLLARVQARAGDWFAARGPAERFLELRRVHVDRHVALHVLGRAAVERGDAEAARALFAQRDAARRWSDVLRVRRLQVLRSPDEPLPRLGLALVWIEAEAFEAATAVLEALVARWPDHARAWFHLGECRRERARLPAALKALETALRLEPGLAPARVSRAQVLAATGREGEAQAALEELLAGPAGEDPALAAGHLTLARLLLRSEGAEAASARYAVYRALGGTQPLEPR